MNHFVMAVLPIPAWNIKGHPSFQTIGDPPSSGAIAVAEEKNPVSVSLLVVAASSALGYAA